MSQRFGPRKAVCASTVFQSSPSSLFLSSPNILPARSLIVEWPWLCGWAGLLFPETKLSCQFRIHVHRELWEQWIWLVFFFNGIRKELIWIKLRVEFLEYDEHRKLRFGHYGKVSFAGIRGEAFEIFYLANIALLVTINR